VAKAILAERDPHLQQLRSLRNKLQKSVEDAKASATSDLFARCFLKGRKDAYLLIDWVVHSGPLHSNNIS
jgi:hypothetical protein